LAGGRGALQGQSQVFLLSFEGRTFLGGSGQRDVSNFDN
jgi:hypothetical protein